MLEKSCELELRVSNGFRYWSILLSMSELRSTAHTRNAISDVPVMAWCESRNQIFGDKRKGPCSLQTLYQDGYPAGLDPIE